MKNIYKYAMIASAVLSLAACNDLIESSEPAVDIERAIILTATREGTDPNTRSVRMDDGTTWWGPKEEISVFYGSGSNGGSKFTSNNTTLAETTEFEGSISMSGNKEFWAVYPYSTENTCDGSSIVTVIPSKQTGSEGNFADDAFPAIGKSSSLTMPFWNICGGIKFFVSRTDIKSVTIKGNNGEALTGKVKVTFNSDGHPEVAEVIDGQTEVTLTAPGGGCFKPGKYYYITLLPTSLDDGLTMTFTTETRQGELVSEKAQTVKRSVFGVLKNIDSKVDEWIEVEGTLKGWDVFIWHDAKFKFDDLSANPSYFGYDGTARAPRLGITQVNKTLNVTSDEFNQWVLNDVDVNMDGEDFGIKYDLSRPRLILAKGGVEPGDELPAYEDAVLVDIADINTYYSKFPIGLALTVHSSYNFQRPFEGVDLAISSDFDPLNDYDVHNVYVLFPAKDNTKNIDVVVKFSFKIRPHEHNWTILKKYDDKYYWTLNPDIVIGSQDLLVEEMPSLYAYYGDEPYVTYGAVRKNGLESEYRSAFVEHFKVCANCWMSANEESDYIFKIFNYKKDVVDIVKATSTAYGDITYEDDYAVVTIHGADLKKMADPSNTDPNAISPDILVKKPAGLNVGKDILVQVTELCSTEAAGTAIKDLKAEDYGMTYIQAYYYLSFRFPEAVDLGLPSGLKWATMNVGASAPEEYGDYFAWGETEPKWDYDWSTYKFELGTDYNGPFSKYVTNSSYGTVDNKTVLDPEDDAAHVNWGGSWRMPTDTEWAELINTCTLTWTGDYNGTGVAGIIVTSNISGYTDKSIFLPAAGRRNGARLNGAGANGRYWSSSLISDLPYGAWGVNFLSGDVGRGSGGRYNGRSVRPVYGEFVPVSSITLDNSSLGLRIGDSAQLNATISPSIATAPEVRWVSGDETIVTVDQSGNLSALAEGSTTVTAYSSNGLSASCAVNVFPQLTAEGRKAEAVDLGLSVKWATYNVGATKPEEYGDYFAWGETEPKTYYRMSNYKWCNGSNNTLTKYCPSNKSDYWDGSGSPDNKMILDTEDDAASVNWGANWRIPTDEEWTELKENCIWTWTSNYNGTGIEGRIVKALNGNSIFIPASGNQEDSFLGLDGPNGLYWSSTLNTVYPSCAWCFFFNSNHVLADGGPSRSRGYSIRPVYPKE